MSADDSGETNTEPEVGTDEIPLPIREEPRTAVVRGLRHRRSETQLTQVLAAVLRAESGLATEFVRLVVNASPGSDPDAPMPIPEDLTCDAEVKAEDNRFDLMFRSPTDACVFVVEMKIHAPFGPDQIAKYRKVLGSAAAQKAVLVAITRDTPLVGAPPPEDGRPAWLGCVSWAHLLDGLRDLESKMKDTHLREQWVCLLDVLEEEGAMGFTHADRRYFDAWLYQSHAVSHLKDFVDAIRTPIRDRMRTVICPDVRSPSWAAAANLDLSSGGKGIKVGGSPHRVYAGLRLQASGAAEVQFGVGSWDTIYVYVELTRLTHAMVARALPETEDLVDRLTDCHFKHDNPKRPLRAILLLTPEVLASRDLAGDAASWIAQRLEEAHAAGAFAIAATES